MVRLKVQLTVRGGLSGDLLDAALRNGLEEGLHPVHAQAGAGLPPRFRPALRTAVERGPDGNMAGRVWLPKSRKGLDTFVGRLLEQGVRPHVIEPARRGGLLAFVAGAGHLITVKRVQHPGFPPRPWLRVAWDANAAAVRDAVMRHIRLALNAARDQRRST